MLHSSRKIPPYLLHTFRQGMEEFFFCFQGGSIPSIPSIPFSTRVYTHVGAPAHAPAPARTRTRKKTYGRYGRYGRGANLQAFRLPYLLQGMEQVWNLSPCPLLADGYEGNINAK